jgi:hypothetical protein
MQRQARQEIHPEAIGQQILPPDVEVAFERRDTPAEGPVRKYSAARAMGDPDSRLRHGALAINAGC